MKDLSNIIVKRGAFLMQYEHRKTFQALECKLRQHSKISKEADVVGLSHHLSFPQLLAS